MPESSEVRTKKRRKPRLDTLVPDLILLALCAVAFAHGVRVTAHLDWPYDLDQYRDVGIAQSFLDGQYPNDYLLLDETISYPPLTAALVASVSAITGSPPHVVDTRLGAYLNLLIPLCFYWLIARMFGRWAALAATAYLLFAVPVDAPSWAHATYSPWLFAPTFAQCLFYLTLLAYRRMRRTRRRSWAVVTGVALGITFLGHVVPAVLLGCVIVAVTGASLFRLWRRRKRRPSRYRNRGRSELADLMLIVAVAFVVGLPLGFSLIGHHHLKVENPLATYWNWEYLQLEHLPRFLREWASLSTAVACAGAIGVIAMRRRPVERRLVFTWLAVAFAFLAYSFVWQVAARYGVVLRQLAPGYHFLFYLSSAKAVLYGCGIAAIARCLLWGAVRCKAVATETRLPWQRVLVALGIAATLAKVYPSYPTWFDLTRAPRTARERVLLTDNFAPYDWVMANAEPSDVFLCNDRMSLLIVAPAARKVVATNAAFSSPYVDWQTRDADRAAMFAALRNGDRERFAGLAAAYRVTHVIVTDEGEQLAGQPDPPYLERVFESNRITIYRLALDDASAR